MYDFTGTINPQKGSLQNDDANAFNFDKASINPVFLDKRYVLSAQSLGHLERLAKARFLLSEIAPDFDPSIININDPDTQRSICLNVFASSEIEGEGFSVEHLEPFVAACTQPSSSISSEKYGDELAQRIKASIDISKTYFWALSPSKLKQDPIISLEFILDAHKRMFGNTHKDTAGIIKKDEVIIKWTRAKNTVINVPTVAPDKCESYLRALCDRTNELFSQSFAWAGASMFLAAAEFACDFLAIHPFSDGNGRTARLLSSYLLERGGYHFTRIYPIDQVVLDSRPDYYESLNSSQKYWHSPKEDLSPWVNYFISAVFEQWERAFRRIRNNPKSFKSTPNH
jgi:Fic family protein